ncbi:hypothetical protein TREES_T100000764 [Tupaia chinensis]|uniref:Uncharacterized protein n=1 Tax=Tupaia chinensis TaxID=246437 RepID=L9KJ26_TUPCH|nr:hypothetical protein TREES_T100000764 [Tupaia chinensis]
MTSTTISTQQDRPTSTSNNTKNTITTTNKINSTITSNNINTITNTTNNINTGINNTNKSNYEIRQRQGSDPRTQGPIHLEAAHLWLPIGLQTMQSSLPQGLLERFIYQLQSPAMRSGGFHSPHLGRGRGGTQARVLYKDLLANAHYGDPARWFKRSLVLETTRTQKPSVAISAGTLPCTVISEHQGQRLNPKHDFPGDSLTIVGAGLPFQPQDLPPGSEALHTYTPPMDQLVALERQVTLSGATGTPKAFQ